MWQNFWSRGSRPAPSRRRMKRSARLAVQQLEDRTVLSSTPHGQVLSMSNGVYGPNEGVEITFAKIAFINAIDCGGAPHVGDFLSPAADVYIVPSGFVGGSLTDAGGVLNTWSRFAIPAFTPVLLNLAFIGMALFAAPYFDPPVLALAWAVFLGGLLQLALQLRPLARIGMLPRFDLDLADPGVRRILKLMAPAILGVSVSQISLLINTIFASFLASGSVSWLYYADRLMEFPAGLLGVALGTILLPSLSKLFSSMIRRTFAWVVRLMSPTSSRNRVPPSAASNFPTLLNAAPVNAPFSWPNNSLARRSGVRATQLTATKGCSARGLHWWIARAITSLPVPLSPSMSTVVLVVATVRARRTASCIAALVPCTWR